MLVCSACKVGSEDIEKWKDTVKGPGKIVAVMLADKYPIELRTEAALALVDMERPDRDGTADLQQALARLEEKERNEIIGGMVPGLEALMKQADPGPGNTASAKQIRAKDAAFLLVTNAPPDVKAKLTDDVIAWYMEDFNGRSLAGNFSAEQVVTALGAPAGKELVKGLKARMPSQALVKMAQLVGQVADPQAKKEGATRMVAIYAEMEGKEFLAWLRQMTKDQIEKGGGKVPDAKALDEAAEHNREARILEGALPAMKWLAGEPQVQNRLFEIAEDKRLSEERRTRALQALEGKVGREDLQRLLGLAKNRENPTSVRDYAFDRVGDVRSPDAVRELWPMMSEDPRVRWRVGELALASGGGAVISELFQRLPTSGEYPPEELDGYAARIGQITPAPVDFMRDQLKSPNWYVKVVAIRYFERKGSLEDVGRLEALRADKTSVKGPRWEKITTVGEVATEAAANAVARLGQPSAK